MIRLVAFAIAALFSSVLAHDYSPGERQRRPVLLRGGDLYTVSHGIKEVTDLLFEDGRITRIGQNLTPPDNTEVIDVSGKRVYPGLIAPYTTIGLIEIGEVRATNDISEVGQNNPNVQAHVAYNPDSEIIPTVRANGVTTALVVPHGNLVLGRSVLVNLDGWTVEDAAEKFDVGLHIRWPRASVVTAWWMDKSPEEQKTEMIENRRKIRGVFDDASAYYIARQADPTIPRDLRWDAMVPVLAGDLPTFILADDYRQIEQAIAFAEEYGVSAVIVGGSDAWMAADLLNEKDIPVIVGRTQSLPAREDEGYDLTYRLPALLAEAGVKFCLSSAGSDGGSSWSVRNLPFQAGQAVAFGLSPEDALRAVTLSTAEILGVDVDLGSLQPGKKATLVVADGDILNPLTHHVVMEFIEGRRINLDSKQRELYRKYLQKQLDSSDQ